MTVARSFSLSGMNNEAEQSILSRIRSIDSLLGRISGMEVPSGYGPYDDLEAIPTVFKESPVYLRPLPGVTLRSARFDNNVGLEEENVRQTASSYFADATQKRLLQILGDLNVQVPRMATKRICDTLDRLKQDIVKLILLRVGVEKE